RQGHVATTLLAVVARGLALLPSVQRKGFQATEAEIQSRPISHRTRKDETSRSAVLGQASDFRTTRIRQAHHLGGFIEGFACRIVQRLAEQLITTDTI